MPPFYLPLQLAADYTTTLKKYFPIKLVGIKNKHTFAKIPIIPMGLMFKLK